VVTEVLTQEIWIALVFIDVALTIWFFLDMKNYWSNLICAGLCYLLSTGISDAMTVGIDNAGTVVTDPWLASIFAWHSYLMLALCGLALLKNTILSEPEKKPSGKGRNRNNGW
jgi:hypothetical protein